MVSTEVYLTQVLKQGQELDHGLKWGESVLSRRDSRQRSGVDAQLAKVQGCERGHRKFGIYSRSAQLECGIWDRAGG